MNSINISDKDFINYMVNTLSTTNNERKNINLINICQALLNAINGINRIDNKHKLALYGSIIPEILNQINNKPFTKIKNINLLVKSDNDNTSNVFKAFEYQKIPDLYSNNNVIETGKLNVFPKYFDFELYVTVIDIDIPTFINKLPYEFNKGYYMLNSINTSVNYNKPLVLHKKNVDLNLVFLLQQVLHGMRFKINCSI